jgi:glycosyltransferase involved in cell wall biosynthesis
LHQVKIAIDIRRLRDFGIGTYIRNLLNALAVEDTTNEYLLLAQKSDAPQLAHLPSTFRPIFYERRDTDRMDHLLLPIFLRSLKPDLVHFPTNRVPLLLRSRYVVTVHDMSALLFSSASGLRTNIRRFAFRSGLLRAAKVIAVSATTSRDVQNILSIPPDRIQIVYNAPAPEFFDRDQPALLFHATGPAAIQESAQEAAEAERSRILERYRIQQPFLLYAGNIRPQKNIPRLVEAFAVARAELENDPRYERLRLIIIGDEISKYPAVRRAVMQSRVEHSVRFLGFVPFETLRVFYELAAAFVFPSLYEGFGLPPLEAMASGTPVVASEIGALPEAVGDAAVLVNPENVFDIARGIREVLLNDELRAGLIEKGRRHAATFSWGRTAREVIAIYSQVCAKRAAYSNDSNTDAR